MVNNILKDIPFFEGLSEAELNEIMKSVSEQEFEKDEVVFREGEIGHIFYIINSGSVKICKLINNGEETNEEVLSVRKAGEFFGEMALIDEKPRSASVIAVEKTELLAIDRDGFYKIIAKEPIGTFKIVKALSERLREADMHLIDRLKKKNQQLRVAYEELNELNKNLENKVKERTQELEDALHKLKEAQAQIIQSEKMAALGQLVGGIAHEINNPLNFISGNVYSLERYISDFKRIINEFDRMYSISQEDKKNLDNLKSEIDYSFISFDVNEIIKSLKNGVERIKKIVFDLRSFSKGATLTRMVDIHNGIESSLSWLSERFGSEINIYKDYGEIPNIECVPGEINQVFMNILQNAIEAVQSNKSSKDIWIKTHKDNESVIISIKDNGKGIPDEIKNKIFDPFFTTKETGKGTGLGLSSSYGIVKKHNGKIEFDSKTGQGTEFKIILPVKHSK
jgi:signal transduction histidine kinase